MNHHELISDRINKATADHDITMNRLATLSGVTQSTLSGMMNRPNAVPKLDTLYEIANGLNMSLTELLDFPPYNERPDGTSPKAEQSKWDKLGNVLTTDEKERVRKALLEEDE